MKNIFTFVAFFFFFGSSVSAQTPEKKELKLTQGKTLSDSLSSQSVHSYSIQLDSAQVVFGRVFQETVDVVVKISDEEGKSVGRFDSPARGPENFMIETRSAGKYRIEVTPFEEEQGRYNILISTIQPVAKDPKGKTDQYMIPYSGNEVPGGAIMVVKDGKTLFEKGYGMANLSYNIPFEIETPTNIGSTSKQFTAFAILLLAQEGKLSLDDDIRNYFPELPEFEHPVTIRHLLTHTSGYREFLNTLGMAGRDLGNSVSRALLFKVVQRQPELQNIPGAEWNYNNTGYALLAQLVAEVTEIPFPEWMETRVFQPLGMKNTQVRADQFTVLPDRSQGYVISEQGTYQEVSDLGGAMGAGGIYSTLPDLVKWVQNFRNPKVGSPKIIEQMTTPYVLSTGDTTSYGLGLFIEDYKGQKRISHGGADVAHRSMLSYFPEINAIVVVQSNNAGFDGTMDSKIAETFFPTSFEQSGTATQNTTEDSVSYDYEIENFDALAGRYELAIAPGFILSFYRDGDRIFTQATGQGEVNLTAESDSLFRLQGVNAKLTFHLKKDGTADSLTLHQNGNHLARKIKWAPTVDELQAFTGNYFSDEIGAVYSIILKDDKLYLSAYQMAEDMALTTADKDVFGGGYPIAEIKFERDSQGKITGFRASNGRTRGVLFRKF